MWCERKRGIKNDVKAFGLSYWEDHLPLTEGRTSGNGGDPISFRLSAFELPMTQLREEAANSWIKEALYQVRDLDFILPIEDSWGAVRSHGPVCANLSSEGKNVSEVRLRGDLFRHLRV